jgi:propanol-preferring alcohol dehydrogenase
VVQAKLEKGQWLGVVGSGGGLGHIGIQFAKALGLKIVGVDARDEGLELTRELGADLVVDARTKKGDVVKEVMKVTGGEGCYATINLSDARSAAALACAITRMHGRVIQIAQVGGLEQSHQVWKATDSMQPDEVSVSFREMSRYAGHGC